MGIEFELKFRATPESQEKIWQASVGEAAEYEMQTTYYDTPSGALSARWCTLRCRKENAVSVCTLKLPAEGGGRKELEVFCDSIEQALLELCKLAELPELPKILQEGVLPVCGARFKRRAKTVVLPQGTVELALDRGVLTGGGRELPLCEVEVELKSGSREAAVMYATQLALAYGLQPEKNSKFHRAKCLAKGENDG